ncbi:hypothetical protein UFOVP1229_147 [uncultured Caudovirales phage]|uniref:Uncharacterized protein n=1 Tax=uncultured Caudovirales phage TaxID=2100421 RepID=A0A6J5R7M8_9CAUD|nr:hypothetical protein UFOVP1229_147 [uncultured Caudovirales phage]
MKKQKTVIGKTIGEHLVEGFEELRDIVRSTPVIAFCPFCGSDDVVCVSNGNDCELVTVRDLPEQHLFLNGVLFGRFEFYGLSCRFVIGAK